MRRVRFRVEASANYAMARDWYEDRAGLGSAFEQCIEDKLLSIRENPELYPIVHGSLREALVRRFPYAIYFAVEEDTILVVAVFHSSRDPSAWQSRIDN